MNRQRNRKMVLYK